MSNFKMKQDCILNLRNKLKVSYDDHLEASLIGDGLSTTPLVSQQTLTTNC